MLASQPESPQDATTTAAQPSSSQPADPFKTGCQNLKVFLRSGYVGLRICLKPVELSF
jgi:hypothetical protein